MHVRTDEDLCLLLYNEINFIFEIDISIVKDSAPEHNSRFGLCEREQPRLKTASNSSTSTVVIRSKIN